jgi:hypothetical protein
MACPICLRYENCECVFNCSECDAVMVEDEINGGHLCPGCDANPHHSDWAGDVFGGSDDLRRSWANETFRVKTEEN